MTGRIPPDLDPRLVEAPYPFQTLLGMRMVGWGADFARFELPVRPELGNRHGIPHGGVYASLLDTVMGFAGCWTGDPQRRQMAMTLSLTTNFLAPATGTVLIGEGRRIGGGRSIYFAEATITDDAGTLVATGAGTFRYRKGG